MTTGEKTIGVGMIVFKNDDVLLIKRGKEPLKGQWSLPGGRLEDGEDMEVAAHRELMEETSVTARVHGLAGVVDFENDDHAYTLVDYWGTWKEGEPTAGDDAVDAKFFPLADIPEMGLWDETTKMIMTARDLHQKRKRGHSLKGHARAFLNALLFGLGAYAVISALKWLLTSAGLA
ncbi:MAG: NUDIX hydrolase [Sphingomonadales bacterium]|nr:NUDIX hydrolase [Sphingomonadales bacterium]